MQIDSIFSIETEHFFKQKMAFWIVFSESLGNL